MNKIFLIIFLFFLTLFPGVVYAQENWAIDNFDSKINILKNGKVSVTEKIDADFGQIQKHGILRNIPYLYYLDSKQYYTEASISSVLVNNTPVVYKTNKNGNFTEIKIGDPNKTISGKVRYKIDYQISGVLRSFEDHDELYWDVTGDNWIVPIKKASATITLDTGTILKIDCFEGSFGSNDRCLSKKIGSYSANFRIKNELLSGQGLTILIGFPKNTFPLLKPIPPKDPVLSRDFPSKPKQFKVYTPNILLTIIFTSAGFYLIYFFWSKRGKDGVNQAIMVEYSPPLNLRPAQLGTLMDESADTLDVAATIVDLAVRGYIKIEEKPKKWFLGKDDFVLEKISKDNLSLLLYEKLLLEKIFRTENSIKISELKNKFYYDLVEIKSQLYKNVTEEGFFYTNPEKMRKTYAGFSILALIASVSFFAFGLYSSVLISSLSLAVVICSMVFIPVSKFIPKKTTKGFEIYKKGLGYKMFLEKVETYKQKFLENKNLFSEVMPYTIIFGITEKFAKEFEKLGIPVENPNWYTSSKSFNYITFSSSMNSFSFLMTSAIAYHASAGIINSFSVSSSSGFSTGGGFSGGGFGGGGGGSW